jgi:hypothetical protein
MVEIAETVFANEWNGRKTIQALQYLRNVRVLVVEVCEPCGIPATFEELDLATKKDGMIVDIASKILRQAGHSLVQARVKRRHQISWQVIFAREGIDLDDEVLQARLCEPDDEEDDLIDVGKCRVPDHEDVERSPAKDQADSRCAI